MSWRDDVPQISLSWSGCTLAEKGGHLLFEVSEDPIAIRIQDWDASFRVPVGFLSDGSSVPGALWAFLAATPADLLLPGFVHDYAYREGAEIRVLGDPKPLSRYQADLLHVAVCRQTQVVGAVDQAQIFYALRVGGAAAWHAKEV